MTLLQGCRISLEADVASPDVVLPDASSPDIASPDVVPLDVVPLPEVVVSVLDLLQLDKHGIDPKRYVDLMSRESERRPTPEMDETTRAHVANLPINHQRTTRILRTYTVSTFLKRRLEAIRERQVWMVLTEPWCGDSAQSIPCFIKFAECNPLIEIRFVLRDQHPQIMDRYLTNGTRGIPKLVAFDSAGEELFTWGPRPREGQALFEQGKAEGLTKGANLERLHLWYARNRGAAIEEEFARILNSHLSAPAGVPADGR
jgi:hypothetical protein